MTYYLGRWPQNHITFQSELRMEIFQAEQEGKELEKGDDWMNEEFPVSKWKKRR